MTNTFLPTWLRWFLRIVAAFILAQTLFFKFSAAPESVEIFTKLGAEPEGRIASGVFELITVIFLLWRRTSVWGAVLGIGVMSGAILSHLARLGIEVQGDGGLLFGLAITVWVCCALIAADGRSLILEKIKKFGQKN